MIVVKGSEHLSNPDEERHISHASLMLQANDTIGERRTYKVERKCPKMMLIS